MSQKQTNNTKVKLLDPKIDAVFQILFSKSNPEIIKSLLSSILNLPISSIENNTLNLELNKILDRTYPTDKIGILDVRIRIDDEMEIDLEMQMLYKEMLIERLLWYWAKLYSNQLKSGNDYSCLKKTLEILIINDTIPEFKNILKPCTRWQIREHELFSEILTDKFEIVIIELPKVEQAYLKDSNNLLLQWMMFLLNPESLEVSEIMEKNESIKVATKELELISEEEINQRIAELREKARRDDVALRQYGERIGREKAQKEFEEKIAELKEKARRDDVALRQYGERIGREKAQKEFDEKTNKIVKKLTELNFSLAQISEIIGLSPKQIEEITK